MSTGEIGLDRGLVAAPGEARSWLDRQLLRLIRDERDLRVVRFLALMSVVQIPLTIWIFAVADPAWWLMALVFVSGQMFTPPYILALHVSAHRPIFKTEFRFLQTFTVWVLGPLAGETPETYVAHHMGMHHPENNMENDLSSTLPYRRDRLTHFLHYFGRFMFAGAFELLAYMKARGRTKLFWRIIIGEGGFFLVVGALLFVRFEATMTVFVARMVLTRFLMMAGNWAQHAFVDPSDPENPYANSIVCLDSRYNRQCFNDGFHVGHHVRAHRHWSEMPDDFLRSQAHYAKADAVVFRGLDYGMVWLLLMLKQHERLAARMVRWPGDERSVSELADHLRSRLGPQPAA